MSEKNVITFGDYSEPDEGSLKGRLSLAFQSETLDLDEMWESSSLSASFLSTFWGKFFPKRDSESGQTRKDVEDVVRYICGELLGNAVKFSFEPEYLIEICLYLSDDELRFYVTNSVSPDDVVKFQSFIQRVITEDTNELFLEQMEKSAADESSESGIGYLTLINDYGATLSWKFEEKRSGINIVTVLARLPIVRKK